MRVLVIGGGAREHAIGWKLKQSPRVDSLYFSPGNGGTIFIGENILLDNSNHDQVLSWVKDNRIDFLVVGQDQYLAEGLVDVLESNKIKVFGPTKSAAEIEWSKLFAKELMKQEGIPTAKFESFVDIESALAYVENQNFPLVIKADGLAGGKGVAVVGDFPTAEKALGELMEKRVHGSSGDVVIIEEYLVGKEISLHAFCDGKTIAVFPSAQDHKRIFENDEGPNTGGMGAIAPVPWVTDDLIEEITEKIIKPTLDGLKKRGRVFKGILYPGIMVTAQGPKVIEFNARFGDPETQAYVRLLDSDLMAILEACVDGKLEDVDIRWSKEKSACCVVLASRGYPGQIQKGVIIDGADFEKEDIVIFHAGTERQGLQLVTNGGRVLGVTAVGDNLKESLSKSYSAIEQVHFDGMQFRRDIGKKSLG